MKTPSISQIRTETYDFLVEAYKRNESVKGVLPQWAYEEYRAKIQREIDDQEYRLTLDNSVIFLDEGKVLQYHRNERKKAKQKNKRLK